jgi:hypothetical protein
MREQAYLGWMIYLLQPTTAEIQKMSFQKWLTNFGLLEEKVEDIESMKKKSLEIAKKIVDMDKKARR